MRLPQLEQLASHLAALPAAVIALWSGLALLSVALFVLSRTRWGQDRPLRKCLVLSILAHVLLMGYATTVQIVAGQPARDPEPAVHISLNDGNPWEPPESEAGAEDTQPWASHHHDSAVDLDRLESERAEFDDGDEPTRRSRAEELGASVLPALDQVAMVDPVQPDPQVAPAASAPARNPAAQAAAPIEAPEAERREAPTSELPNAPRQRKQTAPSSGSERTRRSTLDGIVTSLLEQRVPLPRLNDVPITVNPNRLLAGPVDAPTRPGHGEPAQLQQPDVSPADAANGGLRPSSLTATTARALPDMTSIAGISGLTKISPPETGSDLIGPPALGRAQRPQEVDEVPQVYRLRVAPNRSEIALRYGATSDTEAAVRTALKWLADNQQADGSWDPAMYGGGEERRVLGRNRFGAGARAKTGISALALLAFLAAGHTHDDGVYAENVRRGLEFLIRSQGSDGNLGGEASTYAFMYCHAMATFALSEAYGMTNDRLLESPVRRAVMYTVTAQHPTTGGWRYNIGDEGDTSQLGWQLMALKSAELAGIPMPAHTRQGAIRYLESVSSGRFGGLGAYRPVESPSRPMTAEALACRYFLGTPPTARASEEAAEFLMAELPGEAEPNFYYWYYATLGLYQAQGDAWERWNAALQRELLARQRSAGNVAGSWDPDTVWGGYGGRVYTTALATLCLEVYYRFMPLYVEAAAKRPARY